MTAELTVDPGTVHAGLRRLRRGERARAAAALRAPAAGRGWRRSSTATPRLEGYGGRLLHGGVIAAALDGAMTHCLFAEGLTAVRRELIVKYKHPVTIGRRPESGPGWSATSARSTCSRPELVPGRHRQGRRLGRVPRGRGRTATEDGWSGPESRDRGRARRRRRGRSPVRQGAPGQAALLRAEPLDAAGAGHAPPATNLGRRLPIRTQVSGPGAAASTGTGTTNRSPTPACIPPRRRDPGRDTGSGGCSWDGRADPTTRAEQAQGRAPQPPGDG